MPCACESDTSIAARLCNLENIVSKIPTSDDLFTTKAEIQKFNDKNGKALYSDEDAEITALFKFTEKCPRITTKHTGDSSEIATMCDVAKAISELRGNIPGIVEEKIGTIKEDITKAYKESDNKIIEDYKKADEKIISTLIMECLELNSPNEQEVKGPVKFTGDLDISDADVTYPDNIAFLDDENKFEKYQIFERGINVQGAILKADEGITGYKQFQMKGEGTSITCEGPISGTYIKASESETPSTFDEIDCTKIQIVDDPKSPQKENNYSLYLDETSDAYFGGKVTFKNFDLPAGYQTTGRLEINYGEEPEDYKPATTDYIAGKEWNEMGFGSKIVS